MELGLDDDATAIYTAATGIKILCLRNRWEEAKKSQVFCVILEEWLREHYVDPPSNARQDLGSLPNMKNGENSVTKKHVCPKVLAAGFCAVGISQAHWANLTYETSERAAYQSKAISNFRIASGTQSGDHLSTEDLYAFALALSKNRDIDSAVGVIKQALSRDAAESVGDDVSSENKVDGGHSLYKYKRRQVLRCWHLLALLLSAKQKFSTAIASCEAGLELFGLDSTTSDRSLSQAAIELIEFSDRESIIEISMTHLALSEVVDGPEEAVNNCRDLFALYGKFFGHSETGAKDFMRPQVSPPPSRHGTIKSIRSSFLGRSRNDNRKPSGAKVMTRSPVSSSVESFSGFPQKTPTISVTAEDSSTYHGTSHHSRHFFHHESKKLHKGGSKRSITSARKSRAASMIDGSNVNGIQSNSDVLVPNNQNGWPPGPWPDGEQAQNGQSFAPDEVGVAISHDSPPVSRPAAAVPVPSSNAQGSQPIPLNRRRSPPSPAAAPQHLPLPKIFPAEPLPPPPPIFSVSSRTRRSLTILTRIWLQVASLYRRAKMPTDASGAVSEALAHVSTIENLVTLQHSSAEIFLTPEWGGVPSVSELWADAFSERARLHELLGEQDEAEADYETALTHFSDHPGAIIGLCNILLNIYSQTTPPTSFPPSSPKQIPLLASIPRSPIKPTKAAEAAAAAAEKEDSTLLPRLSARDRAAGLLSSLTKSGQGWDCAEAWFALGRAYELRGQIDKAKETLWWVVELEEMRPVRGWGCLGW
jgi:cargo-transport protein YPP1